MTFVIPNSDVVADQCQALATLVARHTESGGNRIYPTAIAPLSFSRSDADSAIIYQDYEPGLALLVQGKKEIVLGEKTYTYEVGQCLVVSVDLLLGRCIVEATPDQPYLGLKLTLDPMQLCEMVAQMNLSSAKKENSVRGLFVSKADATLLDCALRLTKLLDIPQDIPMLAPMMIREIYYRLLMGEQSEAVRQIATSGSSMQRIASAIKRIKSNFTQPMRVEDLAKQVRMSTSSFHQHFKQVTSMSPLQYQKQLRLSEARRLMLTEGCDATSAAYQVGYESPSQFSREYSRLFGAPPMQDIERLRSA
ncbi:AraC family transcriptional regulator [Tolypothrix sp. NIES-4075]|uniref:AraC family transcriptional regulator n=1 Tax=Tolypothrix sp. NIES-4075 TaxID=2005459 RepID=UPI000B5C7018|nr:AraC family transcriptional regulator [Tolypothrix sp. NIES-4075]GAX44250.1 AraC family transcriptional regulator [Tolypothrix sp. NIES-4075]